MGFTDSFFSGVGDFFSGAVGFLDEFAATNIGGQLLEFGLGEFADVIGLEPSRRNETRGVPLGPLGSPVPGGITTLAAMDFCRGRDPRTNIPGTPWFCSSFVGAPGPTRGSLTVPRGDVLPFEGQFGTVRPPTRVPSVGGLRPQFGVPLPPIPSSQPFGVMPGTRNINFGGGPVAFPTFLNASFPASPASLGGLAAPLLRQLPGFIGGLAGGAAVDAVFGGPGGGTPMFRPTMAGARAQTFRATNPATGKDTWFKPMGRPILWSSDLATCRRVDKIARRVRRKR